MEYRHRLVRLLLEGNEQGPSSESGFFTIVKQCTTFSDLTKLWQYQRLKNVCLHWDTPSHVSELFDSVLNHPNSLLISTSFLDTSSVIIQVSKYMLEQNSQSPIYWVCDAKDFETVASNLQPGNLPHQVVQTPQECEALDFSPQYRSSVLVMSARTFETALQANLIAPLSRASLIVLDDVQHLLTTQNDSPIHQIVKRIQGESEYARPRVLSVCREGAHFHPSCAVSNMHQLQEMLGNPELAQMKDTSYDKLSDSDLKDVSMNLAELEISRASVQLQTSLAASIVLLLELYSANAVASAQKGAYKSPKADKAKGDLESEYLTPFAIYANGIRPVLTGARTIVSGLNQTVKAIEKNWASSPCKLVLQCVGEIMDCVDVLADLGLNVAAEYQLTLLQEQLKGRKSDNPVVTALRTIIEKLQENINTLLEDYNENENKIDPFGRSLIVKQFIQTIGKQEEHNDGNNDSQVDKNDNDNHDNDVNGNDADNNAKENVQKKELRRFLVYVSNSTTASKLGDYLNQSLFGYDNPEEEYSVDHLTGDWEDEEKCEKFFGGHHVESESSSSSSSAPSSSLSGTRVLIVPTETSAIVETHLDNFYSLSKNLYVPHLPGTALGTTNETPKELIKSDSVLGIVFIYLNKNSEPEALDEAKQMRPCTGSV